VRKIAMDNIAIVGGLASFMNEVANLNYYILVPVFGAVSALCYGYFKNYQYPASWLETQLMDLIKNIKATRARDDLRKTDLKARLDTIFNASPFKNIWWEYNNSLHKVYDDKNAAEIKEIYATTPAETFFSKETLIDLQINAGFYRHLPGILTGIGIIGTFTGLVWGLHQFRLDAGLALESLPLLLQEVGSAFVGSGFAILASIFITYKEKDIINRCYILVEELNKELDSTYSMGAGEAYLSRLVNMSERSSTTLGEFRTNLLKDLRDTLNDNTERQLAAQQMQSQMIAEQLANAVKYAIQEPMTSLTEALREVRGDQHEAVSKVLETLVDGFMQRLGQTVGHQMQEINNSIKSSSDALDNVHLAMLESAETISKASVGASNEITSKLDSTFTRILEDQKQVNARLMENQTQVAESMDTSMKSVLSSIQDAVISFAIDRKQHMTQYKESYEQLLSSVKETVETLSSERKAQAEQDATRTDNMLSSIEMIYSDVSSSIDKVATDIKDITFKTAENFETIQEVTTRSLTEMKEGIASMNEAASKFVTSGDRVEALTETMSHATEAMKMAADAMQDAFSDYDQMRATIQNQVSHLQRMVETTRNEAAISQKVVRDIQVVAEALDRAGKQSTEHMDQVNVVLKQAFTDFGEEMVKQVRNISAESNHQLETSLDALSGTVDSMVASVTKLRRAA